MILKVKVLYFFFVRRKKKVEGCCSAHMNKIACSRSARSKVVILSQGEERERERTLCFHIHKSLCI